MYCKFLQYVANKEHYHRKMKLFKISGTSRDCIACEDVSLLNYFVVSTVQLYKTGLMKSLFPGSTHD